MKPKHGKAARPKFHVYFPVEKITDADEYKQLKEWVRMVFPAFDVQAKDAARFFFGVERPQIAYCEGDMTLTQCREKMKSIPAGQRNDTLYRFACNTLKRHGDTQQTRQLFEQEAAKCSPLLGRGELDTIYKSAQGFYHSKVEGGAGYVEPEQYNSVPPFSIPAKQGYNISPPLLADYYLARHTVIIVTDSGNPRIYEYNGGAYRYRTELEVKAALGEYITEFRRGLWQSGKIAEAYSAIIHTPGLFVEQSQLILSPDKPIDNSAKMWYNSRG
jgi:hypothetical protein